LILLPAKREEDGEVRAFRLDAASYVRRCLQYVIPEIQRRKLVFQQDGARSHVAKITRAYLHRKKVKWLDDWPPYSADLNMIEPIWKELNTRVGERCPLTLEELVKAAKEAWEELPQEVINAHCGRFPAALRNV
jgi:transposase